MDTLNEVAQTNAIVEFLQANPDKAFAASDIKVATGVPKAVVRKRVKGHPQVDHETDSNGRVWYRARVE